MTNEKQPTPIRPPIDRRDFVAALGGAAVAGIAAPLAFDARMAHAGPTPANTAETAVGQFYATLSAEQKKAICLPFDHKLRQHISPNWHIRETLIGNNSFTKRQRALIDKIIRNVTTEDGYERLLRQMDDDDGGIENYSVAVFGQPGQGDRKSTRLNSSHTDISRMPSSA